MAKKSDCIIQPLAMRIQQARIAAGLSQSDLARILGVKPQSIQHWERGTSSPKTSRITDVATALGVKASWLLLEEDNDNKSPSIIANGELTIDEQILIKIYRLMDPSRQIIFGEIAKALANKPGT